MPWVNPKPSGTLEPDPEIPRGYLNDDPPDSNDPLDDLNDFVRLDPDLAAFYARHPPPWSTVLPANLIDRALDYAMNPHRRETWHGSFVPGGLSPDERVKVQNRRDPLGGTLTTKEWLHIRNAYNGECAYCSNKTRLELDHMTPIYSGGRTNAANIAPACHHCNTAKRARSLDKWIGPKTAAAIRERHREIVAAIGVVVV